MSNSIPEVSTLSRIILRFLIVLALLTPSAAHCGSYTSFIQIHCPTEFKKNEQVVMEYAVRMKPQVEQFGCGVVNTYSVMTKGNLPLLDSMEEEQNAVQMMPAAARVFSISDGLNAALAKSPSFLNGLIMLANQDTQLFDRLVPLLRTISSSELELIHRHEHYPIYYLLTACLAEDAGMSSSPPEILKKLKHSVAPEMLDVFAMLFLQARSLYSNSDANHVLDLSIRTLQQLGPSFIGHFKMSPSYLAYFLPPKTEEIPDSANLNNAELEKVRSDYLMIMKSVFLTTVSRYNQVAALLIVERLPAPLLAALARHKNGDKIGRYLEHFLTNSILKEALTNPCNKSFIENLDDIFEAFSPMSNEAPLPGTEGNLGLVAEMFTNPAMRILDRIDDRETHVQVLSRLPVVWATLNHKQREVVMDLLSSLSKDYCLNARLVLTLAERTSYLKWIDKSRDAFEMVRPIEDVKEQSAKKYMFILLTSFPGRDSRDSPSLIGAFLKKGFDEKNLLFLEDMTTEELGKHEFTTSDKAKKYLEHGLTAIDIISWVSVPLTGGLSAALVIVARRGAVSAAKAVAKTLGNRTMRSVAKLALKDGPKVAMREALEIIGTKPLRGRPSIIRTQLIDKIDKANHAALGIQLGTVGAAVVAWFLANRDEVMADDPCMKMILQEETLP